MNVAEIILSGGQDSAVALRHRDAVLTYAGLRDAVARFAGGLMKRGLRKGDRIGILSENSLFFVKSYLGIIRAGMVAVPMQTDLTVESFAAVVADAGIREIFVSNRLLRLARPWAEKLGLTLLAENEEKNYTDGSLSQPATVDSARDLAALMFTSGSTGKP
jgi:acyl-CoA synthetase (AMP-forming)/AMP-acid ligase II